MTYIGIDPGMKGGIAVLWDNGIIEACAYSDDALKEIIHELKNAKTRCCLEQVHSMPQQGVSSTFKFGMGYGYIKGVLETMDISYQEIPPQRWKKEFGLGSDKANSIEVCKRLFPDVSLRATERSRTDSDGIAEALLMAEYARRKL